MKKFLPLSERSESKGFTLVELLVVVAIIAVLAVIGIAVFTGVQKNARDARRRADIDSISKALEAHYNTTQNQNCTAIAGTYCALQGSWFSSGTLPTDPLNNVQYLGLPSNGASNYVVCATLEATGQYCQSSQQ